MDAEKKTKREKAKGGGKSGEEKTPARGGKRLPDGVEAGGEGKPLCGWKRLPDRNAKGRFVKGNTAAGKYREEYGDAMLGYFKSSREEVPYPTFEEFAETLGVTVDTLLNWADRYDRFRNCYARAKNIQKGITLQGGMIGVYNQNIVKFMAINNFGMVDKVQTENKLRFEITMPADVDEESD